MQYMSRFQWFVVIVVLALLTLWYTSHGLEGFLGMGGGNSVKKPRIFVSVASYRDKECMETLVDMFAKAKYPERVYVGVCEQNTDDAGEDCKPSKFKYHKNVRRITIPHGEAKGPTYARYLCSTLFRGEEYFMQIDSHSTFVNKWDDIVIAEHAKCPNPSRSVLSTYPHDRNAYGINETSVPIMCGSQWDSQGVPTFTATIKSYTDFHGKPKPVPFMSGGFVFAPGSLVKDVPFDPYLDHIFQGEEVLYSARTWTTGYDIFCPSKNVVLHHYYRNGEGKSKDGKKEEKSAKFWDDIKGWHGGQQESMHRLKRLLALEEPRILPGDDPYSLGKQRTIDEYWEYAGLDPKTKSSTSKDKFCG